MALEVVTFRHGPFWNFSYLLACSTTGEAAVIDPAWDAAAMLAAVARLGVRVSSVFLTHAHSDHANAVQAIVDATGARVFAHEAEAMSLAEHYSGDFEAPGDGSAISIGGAEAAILWTPGHSAGSVSVLADGRLFSGDTLAVGSVGRPGPEREALDGLWESTKQLARLPAETVIHPGHDEGATRSSTVGLELARGGAFGARRFEEFVQALERSTGRSHGS
jgi:glyoxylase-like metal-dependent hydrolase (beta-lactamase superfamily II)